LDELKEVVINTGDEKANGRGVEDEEVRRGAEKMKLNATRDGEIRLEKWPFYLVNNGCKKSWKVRETAGMRGWKVDRATPPKKILGCVWERLPGRFSNRDERKDGLVREILSIDVGSKLKTRMVNLYGLQR